MELIDAVAKIDELRERVIELEDQLRLLIDRAEKVTEPWVHEQPILKASLALLYAEIVESKDVLEHGLQL